MTITTVRDTAGNTDDLRFDDAVPLEGPADIPPPTDEKLSCEVCGTTLVYKGRGRKPSRCDEHKRNASSSNSGKRATRSAVPNDKLAQQATEALVQLNRLTGLGARLAGLETTQEMIMFCEDTFRVQAYEALLTDPNLCKQILAAGAVSAKFSLATAYAMMLGQVAPVAWMELKAKREAKAGETDG